MEVDHGADAENGDEVHVPLQDDQLEEEEEEEEEEDDDDDSKGLVGDGLKEKVGKGCGGC